MNCKIFNGKSYPFIILLDSLMRGYINVHLKYVLGLHHPATTMGTGLTNDDYAKLKKMYKC